MIEVERKFRLTKEKFEEIKNILEAEFGASKDHHQTDVIFLFEQNSFREHNRGEPIMRIRSSDGSYSLSYKRIINEQGDRIEHELSIDSFEEAKEMLEELGYREVIVVDKKRSSFYGQNLSLVLDSIKSLGVFLEVEILSKEESDIGEAELKIMQFVEQFGLSKEDIEERKYDEMLSDLQEGTNFAYN